MAVNYVALIVHRQERPLGSFEITRADVMVSAPDLFQALERSIEILGRAGWVVEDIEEFTIDIRRPTASAGNERLEGLYFEARTEGIAWSVKSLESPNSSSPFPVSPSADGVARTFDWETARFGEN